MSGKCTQKADSRYRCLCASTKKKIHEPDKQVSSTQRKTMVCGHVSHSRTITPIKTRDNCNLEGNVPREHTVLVTVATAVAHGILWTRS